MVLFFLLPLEAVWAETVILHLRNGDRIAGTILSEDTNRVIISTVWIKELTVPSAVIERREKVPLEADQTAAPAPVGGRQKAKPVPQAVQTNIVVAAKPAAAVAAPAGAPKPKPPKHWKADVRVGLDLVYGAKDRENYYGRIKLTYEKPYTRNPREFFRHIFDYSVDYGRTDDTLSANRMNGSSKTDLDVGKHLFVYNLAGAGYDEIRKIDLQYEVGPGLGYHVFMLTNFVLNAEAGLNYQVQERSDNTETKNFYYRLAEDVTWRIGKKVTATEKFEFFPTAEDLSQFRTRFESSLSYWLLQNLSLNLTALDLYDTQPARDVSRNELQIRSSLGVIF